MNRSTCRTISDRVLHVLKQSGLEDELGITFTQGNGKFDSTSFTMKLTATTDAEDGSSQTKEASDFLMSASSFGLSPDDLGKSFQSNGKSFTIVGAKPRNIKYPIIVTGTQGGKYKMPAMTVRAGLGRSTIHSV